MNSDFLQRVRQVRWLALGWLACLPWGASGQTLVGGDFEVTGGIAAGGGSSVGGTYGLTGAVPSTPVAVSVGGEYSLLGGLAGPAVESPRIQPQIRAKLTADKLAELTWDEDLVLSGYVLEFSPALGAGAVWQPTQPQPTGNTFLTPCQQPARYFRLRRP